MRKDPREVSTLSREGMSSVGGLTFYPRHYRAALAYSLILVPLPFGPLLRETFPFLLGVRGREDNGVATFRRGTRVGEVASLRRWLASCAGGVRSLRTWPGALLAQAYQQLALGLGDDAATLRDYALSFAGKTRHHG